jgi:ABC-type Fe3+ transport system substrate-binding protein
MARAKVELMESHRADIFVEQAERWRQTQLLRDYVTAITDAVGELDDADDRAAAKAWINWCTESAEQNDPLAGPPRMPDDPEAEPGALKPFLQSWSPYGPESGRNGW